MVKKLLPVLVVVLSVLAIALFLIFRTSDIETQKSSRISLVDVLGLDGITFQSQNLDNIAGTLGIWNVGVYDWNNPEIPRVAIIPKEIAVVLTNEPQKYSKVSGTISEEEGIGIISSIGQEIEGDTLKIKLHFHKPSLLQLPEEHDIRTNTLSFRAISALQQMTAKSQPAEFANLSDEERNLETVEFINNLLEKEGPVFVIGKTSLQFDFLTSLKQIISVKPVFAQSCQGIVFCGVWSTKADSQHCSSNPDPGICVNEMTCARNEPCDYDIYGPHGTCVCDMWCDTGDDVDILCSLRSTEFQCNSTGSCVSPFDCTDPAYQSSCSWTSGPLPTQTPPPATSTPPPPPTPLPTLPPGSCPKYQAIYWNGSSNTSVIFPGSQGPHGPVPGCSGGDCGWCEVAGDGNTYRAVYNDLCDPGRTVYGSWVSSGTSTASECGFSTRCTLTEACPAIACENLTPPYNPSVTNLTATSATLNWIEGSGGTSANLLRLGEDQAEVDAGCPGTIGTPCLISTELGRGVQTYDTGNILSLNTTYYWRVAEYDSVSGDYIDFGNACNLAYSVSFTTPGVSCDIEIPFVELNGVGDDALITVEVVGQVGGVITTIDFISSAPGIATVTPDIPPGPAFQTTATGVSIGNTPYTATATMDDGTTTCIDQEFISVDNPISWWQVEEGDAVAEGNISSEIPGSCNLPVYDCDPVLITGDPGVPTYGGSLNPGSPNISSTNWNAASNVVPAAPNYAFFESRIPSTLGPIFNPPSPFDIDDVGDGTEDANGYYWLKHTGTLEIINPDAGDIGNKKAIIFVDGDLIISGPILLEDGEGFILAIVSGNITVASSAGGAADSGPHIEGVYYAQDTFITESSGGGDLQLHMRGSVAANNYLLRRDLADNSQDPAEIFEYGVDQVMAFPNALTRRRLIWREVAP